MAEYIVNPNSLGGGYSDFRIITFYYGTDSAEDIYNKIKNVKDENKHLLIHIHDVAINRDYGIHAVQSMNNDTYEFEDVRFMFDSQRMIVHKWIISKDSIAHKSHSYNLNSIETN